MSVGLIVMRMAGSDRKEGCACLLAWRRVVHFCWPGGGLYMSVGQDCNGHSWQ